MCSLNVAGFTGVLLQVKTFVVYPHHYDHEVLPWGITDVFQGFVNKILTFQICLYSHSYAMKHLMPVSSMWPIRPFVFYKISLHLIMDLPIFQ